MKILGYIFALLIGLFGFLMISLSSEINEQSSDPYDAATLGIVFILWAYLLKEYLSRNYKGGPTSVIGAILVGFGIYSSSELFVTHTNITSSDITVSYVVVALFTIGGLILLFHGHRIHKSRTTYNKSINADTKPHE